MRHLSVVEVVRIGGDPFERARKLRLLENFSSFVELAVALKDAFRVGEAPQIGIGELAGFILGEHKPIRRQLDGRRHHALQAQLAVLALGVDQAGHRAGRGDRPVANHAGIGNHLAMRVLVHGFRCGQRSLLAEVDEGGVAVVGAQQQKSSAAQVSGCGMYYRQRKSCGHGRIHRVAALAQHFHARVRGQMVHAHHHPVDCSSGLFVAVGNHVPGVLLGVGRD